MQHLQSGRTQQTTQQRFTSILRESYPLSIVTKLQGQTITQQVLLGERIYFTLGSGVFDVLDLYLISSEFL